MNVQLSHNKGYQWVDNGSVYVKGVLFHQKGVLKEESLLRYFSDVSNLEGLKQKLERVSGIYSVIIRKEHSLLIAVDITRTFPLFYTASGREVFVSDDPSCLMKEELKINNVAAAEFLYTGFVTGKHTLLDGVSQVQAGEACGFSEGKVEKRFFHSYGTDRVSQKSKKELQEVCGQVLNRTIQKLISFAAGSQVVVPLSGGYDSRAIVALLYLQGYSNVLCYTYGNKDSHEVSVSKRVAETLGYDWVFVDYGETIDARYVDGEEFQSYVSYATNCVSNFHLQDYFAIKFLKDTDKIEASAIIAPGHSGDFLGGNWVARGGVSEASTIVQDIQRKHYHLNDNKDDRKNFSGNIKNQLEKIRNSANEFSYSLEEAWNMKERQSKYIVNANRNYEFFGYRHVIPLWDRELVEFFRVLPLKYKRVCLYEEVLFKDVFSPCNVAFKKAPKNKHSQMLNKVKQVLKGFLPKKIKYLLLSKAFSDINATALRMSPLLQDLDEDIPLSREPYIVSKWYLQWLRAKLLR